jgi:hypothetical protein
MRSACAFWRSRAFLCVPLLALGCASQGDALEKRFAKLQEDVTRIQSENDRMAERLDAVELREATASRKEERVATADQPTTVTRPKLKIVHVDADDASLADMADNSAADDSGPRVVIQGEGKTIETRSVPGGSKPASKVEAAPAKKPEAAKAAPK